VPFRGEDNFQTGLDVIAHYYNRSIERYGKLDSVMFLKNIDEYYGPFSHGLYVNNIASLDLEQRGANRLIHRPWQTDFTVLKESWSYCPSSPLCSAKQLIQMLIDIVSKHGCLLLNIPPTPAGELEPRVIELLGEIGDWLSTNGDAIYNTRPFSQYGEGDNIRFTTNDDVLNIILFNWPVGGRLAVRTLPTDGDAAAVKSVTIAATGEELPFTQNKDGLSVTCPPRPSAKHKHAFVLKARCDRRITPTWLR